MDIAVAGTGYVGFSLAVLLAQHNKVTAVDIIPEKVDMINKKNRLYAMNIPKNIYPKKSLILPPLQTEPLRIHPQIQ